jgi:alpha-galactosidase
MLSIFKNCWEFSVKSINKIFATICVLMVMDAFIFAQSSDMFRVDGKMISIEFNNRLYSRVISKLNGEEKILGDFSHSEFPNIDGKEITDFELESHSVSDIQDSIGNGKCYKIKGVSGSLQKEMSIISYNEFPTMLFLKVKYTNIGNDVLIIDKWTNNNYMFKAAKRNDDKAPFWSYQPGSYGWSNDWLQQIHKGFERKNYLGMNWVDYGGGTPVVDIWRQDVGLAVGHTELVPKLVDLPTQMPDTNYSTIAITYEKKDTLKSHASYSSFNTFVAVHNGDAFQTLSDYRNFMIKQGVKFHNPPQDAHESIWCGWGYGEKFKLNEIYGTFPKIKELGIKWIVLDYGWGNALGEYILDKSKFPNGDSDMKKLVDSIHSIGEKAELWINPLSVDPRSDLFRNNTDDLLLNKDGSPEFIQYWKSFFLCPASSEVKKRVHDFITKAFKDWGYDGLKIDGNNLNSVPPCYNQAHHHVNPEESVEQLPAFFKDIYTTARSINPNAVIEICPCGTNYSFYLLPYMNQSVASDPQNSWQIRLKGKVLRALGGSKVVFFGDHVELSDNGNDFASSVGIGAVIGTKFVWPNSPSGPHESGDRVLLSKEKEKLWAKWINIFNENNLSYGNYLGNLYDIGYDIPETHVIQMADNMYFSFYASHFEGNVELRGLKEGSYKVIDYVNNKILGEVKGPIGRLHINFENNLLVKAEPK